MLKVFFKTTVLVVLFFIPQIVFGNMVINEVLYDPEGTDTGLEYVILYNNGDGPYSLTNHCLYASTEHYIFGSFSLGAKEKVIIHWNAEGPNAATDLYTGKTGWSNMGNSSGSVALFLNHAEHNKSTIIDFIRYHTEGSSENKTWESVAVSAGIWTAGAFIPDVSEGKAIKLKIDGQDNNSPSDWIESNPTITPGETTSTSEQSTTQQQASTTNQPPVPNAGNDIIAFVGQEIKFDGTKSTDPENDELAYSWNMGDGKLIEKPIFEYKYLYPGIYLVTLMVYDGRNYATDTITIKIQTAEITINEFMPNPSGKDEEEEWIEIFSDSDSITDISGWQLDDAEGGSKPFVFPQNTLIAPKSYLVFPRQITGIALNNDKDVVRLLLPEGIVFQEVNYEKPPQGKSSARTGEGFIWSVPTPGTANLSIATKAEGKEIIYQGALKTETTKESSRNIAIEYAAPTQKTEGGYKEIALPETNTETKNQLATARESISRHISSNLIYVFVVIVLIGLVIGLLLAKFRKRKNEFPQI